MFKEKWYLYSNDADFALEYLRNDIQSATLLEEKAWLIHFLTQFGQFEEAKYFLDQFTPEILNYNYARATLLRIRQFSGHPNPWEAMLLPGEEQIFQWHCEQIMNQSTPLDIYLGGGLGDQLEFISRLKPSLVDHDLFHRLNIVLPQKSQLALASFLKKFTPRDFPEIRFEDNNISLNKAWISMIPFFALLANYRLLKPPEPVFSSFNKARNANSLLFCWRSKVDRSEKLWAHLRSLPFLEISAIYRHLVPFAKQNGIALIDITNYREHEILELSEYYPVLQLRNNQIKSFMDTVQLLKSSSGIISVDTALVHLSSWFGLKMSILLHSFPDGRWCTNKSYKMEVVQQLEYNNWHNISIEVINHLISRYFS